MIGHEFPYTNLHDVNIDWILQVVKEFNEKYHGIDDAIDAAIASLNTKADELETAMSEYMQGLEEETTANINAIYAQFQLEANEAIQSIISNKELALEAIDSEMNNKLAQVSTLLNSLPHDYQDALNQMQIINATLNGTNNYPELVQGHYADSQQSDSKTLVPDNYRVSTLLSAGCASRRLRTRVTNANGIIRDIIYWTGWGDSAVSHPVPVSTSTTDEKTLFTYTFPADATYFTVVFASDYNMLTAVAPSDLQIDFQWIFNSLDTLDIDDETDISGNSDGFILSKDEDDVSQYTNGTEKSHMDVGHTTGTVRHYFKDSHARQELNDLNDKIDAIIDKQYSFKNVTQIDGVTKLTGMSFSVSSSYPDYVVGSENQSYDSYYFYTDDNTAMYFASASPATPAYISVTYGFSPSKTWETIGGNSTGMRCTNPARKRKSDNNLPVNGSELDISDAIVIITVNTSTTTEFYIKDKMVLSDDVSIPLMQTTGLSTDKAMSQKAVTEALTGKKSCLKYINGSGVDYSTERVEVYIPTRSGYIRYTFAHSINAERNSNIWRISNAYLVSDNFTEIKAITTTGEWECALKILGRSDFSGGVVHGDESYTNIYWFIDGVLSDITTFTSYTEFDDFRIVQTSVLYDPSDGETIIAEHGSEHWFNTNNDKDVVIKQSVKWKDAYTLGYSYMAMFPIAQAAINKLYANNSFTPSAPINGVYPNIDTVYYFSDTDGVYAEFGLSKYPTNNSAENKKFLTQTNGGTVYYKGYYVVCGDNFNVALNALWQSESFYKIIA